MNDRTLARGEPRRGRASRFTVIIILSALVAFGCSSGDTVEAGPTPPDQPSQPGGTEQSSRAGQELVIGAAVNPPILASHYARSAFEGTILRNVHEVLVGRDPATDEPRPELAVSWEQLDPVTWRFKLREGVTFHDGSPLNAEAVAFGLTYVWSAENNFLLRSLMGPELSFRAVSEFVLEVSTLSEDPILLKRLWQSTIPSARQIQERPDEYDKFPIGTGPYQFVRWDSGERVILELNRDWWGFNEGYDPDEMFERVTFEIRTDSSSRFAAFRAREVQLAERIPPLICFELPECTEAPQSDTVQIWYDASVGNPVLGDLRIREAISLAIPRELISQRILPGSRPAGLPIDTAVTGYTDDLPAPPYDPERAAELVKAAIADGVPVDSTAISVRVRQGSFPSNGEVLEVLLAELRRIGLRVEGRMQEVSIFNEGHLTPIDKIPADRNAIWLHKHTNGVFDAGPTIRSFFSCAGPGSQYCNPAVEERMVKAEALSGSARQAAMAEIMKILYDDFAFAAIAHQNLTHLVDDSIGWEPRIDTSLLVKDMKPSAVG